MYNKNLIPPKAIGFIMHEDNRLGEITGLYFFTVDTSEYNGRKIYRADIFREHERPDNNVEFIGSGFSILHPNDEDNSIRGFEISMGRAVKVMFDKYGVDSKDFREQVVKQCLLAANTAGRMKSVLSRLARAILGDIYS